MITSNGNRYSSEEPFKTGGFNNCPNCYELTSGDVSCNDNRCFNSDYYPANIENKKELGRNFRKLMKDWENDGIIPKVTK